MTTKIFRKIAVTGLAAAMPLLAAGTAIADVADVATSPPVHIGDPALWGDALVDDGICANPQMARNRGYNVIEGDNLPNVITGSPAADVIYAYGGNDTVFGGPGDDVLCGDYGHDKLRGEQGNDAILGEAHDDTLRGSAGRDYLDGGGQTDDCDGGSASDAEASCEI